MKVEILTKNENNSVQQGIISKLRDYIEYKNLEPGDKLHSERMLSERFEVSRSNIREAIQKLEFFGILKSRPQSGTFIANIGRVAIDIYKYLCMIVFSVRSFSELHHKRVSFIKPIDKE